MPPPTREQFQKEAFPFMEEIFASALRLARTHGEPIHLLLTDVVMPLMNGLQLAAEVQALRPKIKILLMSAYRTREMDDYRVQLGVRGLFLDKPFTVAALMGAVRYLLDDRAPMLWRRRVQ